jgi:hypothetical protein
VQLVQSRALQELAALSALVRSSSRAGEAAVAQGPVVAQLVMEALLLTPTPTHPTTTPENSAWWAALPPALEQVLPLFPLPTLTALLTHLAAHRHLMAPQVLDGLLTTAAVITQPRLPLLPPSQLLELMQLWGALRVRPSTEWGAAACRVLISQLGGMTADEVAGCLPALVAVRCRPPRQWLLQYMRVVVAVMKGEGRWRPGVSSTAAAGQEGGAAGMVLQPHHISAISSPLLKLDGELGQQWMVQLGVVHE